MPTKTPRYVGEVRPLSEIPPNTPVQLIAPEEFHKNYLQDLNDTSCGILTVSPGERVGTCVPSLNALHSEGRGFCAYTLYHKNYNAEYWRGYSSPANLKAFKVLTGKRARDIYKAYKNWCIASGALPNYAGHIGFDPEIFVTRGDGSVLPAWEFLPDKGRGTVVYKTYNGEVRTYWDGFQAEFTTPAGGCVSTVMDAIREGLRSVLTEARRIDKAARLSLVNVPQIPLHVLENADNVHVALGCDPSLNAYGDAGEVIENPRALPFRFAGGHIHLGCLGYRPRAKAVVKAIDAILGVASVGMFEKFDTPLRRRFYGRAGEYRLPEHGIEYRVLSNAWISHPACAMLVSDLARDSAAIGASGVEPWLQEYNEDRVRSIINECDVREARRYVKENELLFRRLAEKRYSQQPNAAEVMLRVINEGFHSVVDMEAIEDNWLLWAGKIPFNYASQFKWGPNDVWMDHCESAGRNFSKLCVRLRGAETHTQEEWDKKQAQIGVAAAGGAA